MKKINEEQIEEEVTTFSASKNDHEQALYERRINRYAAMTVLGTILFALMVLLALQNMYAGLEALLLVILAWVMAYTWNRNKNARMIAHIMEGLKKLDEGLLSTRFQTGGDPDFEGLGQMLNKTAKEMQRVDNEFQELVSQLEGRISSGERTSIEFRDKLLRSQRLAMVGKVAELFAHEIDNPLLAVLTYLRVARQAIASDRGLSIKRLDRELEVSEKEVENSFYAIRTMFSIIADDNKTAYKYCNCCHLVEEALLVFRHHFEVMGIHIETELVSRTSIRASAGALRKSIFILLYNAMVCLRKVRNRWIKIRVSLEDSEKLSYISIRIEHSAPCMSESMVSMLKDPFYLPDEETGLLGLSMVQNEAAEMGGSLDIGANQSGETRISLNITGVRDEK